MSPGRTSRIPGMRISQQCQAQRYAPDIPLALEFTHTIFLWQKLRTKLQVRDKYAAKSRTL